MGTPTTRKYYSRPAPRYQTDLTAAEWRVIEPYLPPAKTTGRPRAWPMYEIVNAIFYVLRGGIAWRLLPADLPPWGTAYRWFATWRDTGLFETINYALVMADRERAGREASPTAAMIDSQSVKTTEAGGARGYDAGKKINGRKRHALVDTDGRALLVEPHPADIQDRDAGGPLRRASRALFPFIERVFADGADNPSGSSPPPASSLRSCASLPSKSALPFIRAAGSSSVSLPGSAAIADWRRILRQPSIRRAPSSMPPPSCSLFAASAVPREFQNGL